MEETACFFCNEETHTEAMYGGLLKRICPVCQQNCIEEDDEMLDSLSEVLAVQKERNARKAQDVGS